MGCDVSRSTGGWTPWNYTRIGYQDVIIISSFTMHLVLPTVAVAVATSFGPDPDYVLLASDGTGPGGPAVINATVLVGAGGNATG